jgi:phosphopentomutase
MQRVMLIVMDGLGIGELPDAGAYGDAGSNTLRHIAAAVRDLRVPCLESLGLGMLGEFQGIKRCGSPVGCYGRMAEASKAKDTTSGHWEMMGIKVERPFPTYPDGFPPEVIRDFENAIGRKVIGNRPASGTEIIRELGAEHIRTGYPIVYTSADSVFQIAAHKDVIPLKDLYKMCEVARAMLKYPHNVGRVIARPFTGKESAFIRTPERRDYSIPPFRKTVLEYLVDSGIEVVSVGKVKDIFAGRGFTKTIPVSGNDDSLTRALESFNALKKGLVFVTLVDFDTLYGHRNDPEGFARALKDFDTRLPEIMNATGSDDLLIITADHGCDPTTQGTDHTREYVPLLLYSPSIKKGINLGTRESFSDIGATILEVFELYEPLKKQAVSGNSFLKEITPHTS